MDDLSNVPSYMETENRPNPDALLADWITNPSTQTGRLKIFLGMCPGVGKTYSMLELAHRLRREGIDVVAGVIETHGRPETTTLLEGLEILPRTTIHHHGIEIKEFDLDAALKRKPQVILVDELAHTNAEGCRHKKRYQDVLELIDAGIQVMTTLNVQHIESRVDIVREITGITVRETVPDSILDRANDIELVDLPPEELRKRLSAGQVYLGENKQAAAANFFREENLTALREMALRYTAERVDQDLREVMSAKRIHGSWHTRERMLVGVSASPFSESLIRWTRSAARRSNCPWLAVHIHDGRPLSKWDNERLAKNLSLARQLGAEVLLVNGTDFVESIMDVAREHRVTTIVVGRPIPSLWSSLIRQSMADRLIRRSQGIDISVVCSESRTEGKPDPRSLRWRPGPVFWKELWWGLFTMVALTAGSSWFTSAMGYWSVALIFLFTIVVLGLFLGPLSIFVTAIFAALCWNFFFIPPLYTFSIGAPHDVMMFFTFVTVALAMGTLTSKLRRRELAEAARERRTAILLRFIQKTVHEASIDDALRTGVQEIDAIFEATSVIYERTLAQQFSNKAFPGSTYHPSDKERSVAEWVFANRRMAGHDTDTLAQSEAVYFPLTHLDRVYGVIGIRREKSFTVEERVLIEAMASQLALVLAKQHLIEAMKHVELTARSHELQRTLLDCVSHELKTPVTVLQTAYDTLLRHPNLYEPEKIQSLGKETGIALRRLRRVVEDLLEMTKLDSGIIQPSSEWCDVQDLLESSVQATEDSLSGCQVEIKVLGNTDVPVRTDPHLVEHILQNLLINAATHSPQEMPIELSAQVENDQLILSVGDHGSGIKPDDLPHIFSRFYRGTDSKPGGLGLGLSIVESLARILGGTISACNRMNGNGAVFTLKIPVQSGRPPIEP